MSIAVEEISIPRRSINKKEFEVSLQQVSDQIRWIDQKLTMKVDNEIWQSFQDQQNEINFTKSIINRARKGK